MPDGVLVTVALPAVNILITCGIGPTLARPVAKP